MKNGSHSSVLVCGGGPTGLALAIELGLREINCVVVEPRLHPTRLRPRAKTLNTRTLEHFRRRGIADRIREIAPLPPEWSQDIAFRTSFLGREITRITGVLGLGLEDVSPELGQQLPQYLLEEVLREVASEIPSVELLLGSRVHSIEARDHDVGIAVVDSMGETWNRTASFVVGADGARSVVREQMGAEYQGTHALRPNTGIVFRSDRLSEQSTHAPAVQTWILNDVTPGMMGPVDQHGLWWFIGFGVDGTSPDLDPGRLISGAIGSDLPLEVISIDPWTARMELADRCRDGRIFLIGDAAHLNPPFGGHGLNTGIGDAVDLGWKLAGTLSGWAGPNVLDSYEVERRPLHRRVIQEAEANMATLAPELLSNDLDRTGKLGDLARELAAKRIHETKTREFHSFDLVLGHQYEFSPILPQDTFKGFWRKSAVAGVRLPHHWIGPRTSTLDVVEGDYVLVKAAHVNSDGAVEQAERTGVPLKIVTLSTSVMHDLEADWIIVRPDQIVAARGAGEPNVKLIELVAGRPISDSDIC